ncbi:MAG: hypothetical protein LJF04_11595 [Gemmatimonadetes bacterium]|nr:hypothetical protein [Gemmatimonadota bacterium]
MNSVGRRIRRAFGVPLAVLMLAPSVAIPILDRAELEHHLALERPGHDPSTCPPGHDHNLCLQVRANHPVPTVGTEWLRPAEVVSFVEPPEASAVSPRPTRATHHPRAPPFA